MASAARRLRMRIAFCHQFVAFTLSPASGRVKDQSGLERSPPLHGDGGPLEFLDLVEDADAAEALVALLDELRAGLGP